MGSPVPFRPLLCVVDFHHARGPEVEKWFGAPEGTDPAEENDWGLLPFLALSDGAHLSTEDFSYFTLVQKSEPPRSLFGISCTRQIDASLILNKSAEVTRSAVQKAVVVITDSPYHLSTIREKLSVVTKAWFAQKDFTEQEVLEDFSRSLAGGIEDQDNENDNLLSLSLREIVHTFKWQTLVLFKCMLLQPKVLVFGTHCEKICLLQFALLSLIPGLMRALQDCADPAMDTYGATLKKSTSLRSSDRQSLLSYMGLPLQIFGKSALFGPYTPLQQLDTLADLSTKSYLVGSTNSLLLAQKDRYADVLVNLDESSVSVFSPSLRSALALSTADRRWIDFVTQAVNDTWDPEHPERPSTMGYAGSEEFIRMQFEEYLLALLSSIKYHSYAFAAPQDSKALLTEVEADPSLEFGADFTASWIRTENYALFARSTEDHIFDAVTPRHPCAGGLTIEDVQRRLAQQVAELHLDERIRGGREVLATRFAQGQKRIGGFVSGVWADVEALREAQRKKAAANAAAPAEASPPATDEERAASPAKGIQCKPSRDKQLAFTDSTVPRPDLTAATTAASAASARAGAYLSSWGAWAAEKRRGWAAESEGDENPKANEWSISPLAREDAFAAAARSGRRKEGGA